MKNLAEKLSLKETSFASLAKALFNELSSAEVASLNLYAEESDFIRFNKAKVRQPSHVEQGTVELNLYSGPRSLKCYFPWTSQTETDIKNAKDALASLRKQITHLPEDSFIVLPKAGQTSSHNFKGELTSAEILAHEALSLMEGLDAVGMVTSGPIINASFNSKGTSHWFSTGLFAVDYSLYAPNQKAVKGLYSGTVLDSKVLKTKIQEGRHQLDILSRPVREIAPGKYRTYLSPACTHDLIGILNWNGLSRKAIETGSSAFIKLFRNEATLSPKFTFTDDYSKGLTPRFNDEGALSPEKLELITEGKLVNALISSRTAKEFKLTSNDCATGENFRAPSVHTGSLKQEDILKTLGTGLYLNNLHYLNWSDNPAGRITGMTRYACFWVENGEIKAPIKDLRFDESLYHFFGTGLEHVTNFSEVIPDMSTYGMRQASAGVMPGLIVKDFSFTL